MRRLGWSTTPTTQVSAETSSFLRRKDAVNWKDKAGWEVRQGAHTPASQSITVADAAKLWLAYCSSEGLGPTTIAAYEQHVRLHITPVCGGLKLSQITKPKADGIRDKLAAKLSRATAKRVVQSLRAIVAEGMRVGAVGFNVFADVKMKRARRTKSKVGIPLKGELKALIRVAPLTPEPITLPLIFCGRRASELRGLVWRSIDLKRGLPTIEQRADAKNVIGQPKSESGYRTIPLPVRVVATLREWRMRCPNTALNPVFPSVEGRVTSHNYMLNNILAPLRIMAGIFEEQHIAGQVIQKPRYTLHTLRHAAASLWIERRAGPKTVQTWMGHSSIQVTFDIYGHLFKRAEADGTVAGAIKDELIGYLNAVWMQHVA